MAGYLDMNDCEFECSLGTRLPPVKWVAEYKEQVHQPTKSKQQKQHRDPSKTPKQRLRRHNSNKLTDELYGSSTDDPLPPHLRFYGMMRRVDSDYSGPSILGAESEEGHVEYKLRLNDTTPSRFQQLVTQLKFRLSEGRGQCWYMIGVEDNGHPKGLDEYELHESLENLKRMASEVSAAATVIQTPPGSCKGQTCAVVRVSYCLPDTVVEHQDLRVAVAGGVDSGKSTLIAVLTQGSDGQPLLDNGKGSARMLTLRHKHELATGRTSSINHTLLAYDMNGANLNYSHLSGLHQSELVRAASTVVTFSDLGGHEKYSKTSLYGMTCILPDYVMLCVCACSGVSHVTREHLAAALSVGAVPFVVVTKIDTVQPDKTAAVVSDIHRLVQAAQVGGFKSNNYDNNDVAPVITTEEQAKQAAVAMMEQRHSPGSLTVPIFTVSGVTGDGIPLLHIFLAALAPPSSSSSSSSSDATTINEESDQQQQARFQVDSSFEVPNVGQVIGGTVLTGTISTGDQLLLGPSSEHSQFKLVQVTGIQRSQLDVKTLQAGQHATLAVQPVGVVLASETEDEASPGVMSVSTRSASNSSGSISSSSQPTTDDAHTNNNNNTTITTPSTSTTTDSDDNDDVCHYYAALGRSWKHTTDHLVSLSLSASPQPPAHDASTPRHTGYTARKGTVLVSPYLNPVAVYEFEAMVVLLSEQWPIRCPSSSTGTGEEDEQVLKHVAYTPTVHCGGIRQDARVISMSQVVTVESLNGSTDTAIIGGLAAAGVLASSSSSTCTGATPCIARVRFRFMHRPEWVYQGMRLLVRDCSTSKSVGGRVAGAGYIVGP